MTDAMNPLRSATSRRSNNGKPYLLFDAGGTLVFPDARVLARVARDADFEADPDRLMRLVFRIVFKFDSYVRAQRRWRAIDLRAFLRELYLGMGVVTAEVDGVVSRAVEINRERNLWTFTYPWVREILERLRGAGYRMSVISNADGRVAEQFGELGLKDFFEHIVDSAVVGAEKPDPAIFQHAFERLDCGPAGALFFGDVFFLDVWGANRAGVGAVHLDPYGYYQDWPGARVRDIRALPEWLERHAADPARFDLFPARDFALEADL